MLKLQTTVETTYSFRNNDNAIYVQPVSVLRRMNSAHAALQ
jgi:hypothetical protein